MNENFKLKGKAIVRELNNGKVISEEVFNNIVVEDGAERVAEYLAGESPSDMVAMAVGDGATAGDAEPDDQSALINELDRSTTISPTRSDNEVEWLFTFDKDSGKENLSEWGLFDDTTSESGTMLSYIIFDVEKDNENNDLQIEYTLTVEYGH